MKTKLDTFLFESNTAFLNRRFIISAIALFCMVNILTIAPDIYEIFGNAGFVHKDINNEFLRSYQPRLSWITELLQYTGLSEHNSIVLICAVYILFLLVLAFTKDKPFLISVGAWFVHLMLLNSSYLFSYGADYFISFILFINVFLTLSLALNKEKGDVLHSFVVRFIQIHLCIVYFFAGFGKTLGLDWIDGNAIWYVANSFAPNTVDTLVKFIDFPIIFKVLSWSVFIELLYPFLIFHSKIGKWLLIMIFTMHVFIAFGMGLYTFGAVMILMNIIGFGHYFKWKRPLIFVKPSNKLGRLLRPYQKTSLVQHKDTISK